MRHITRRVGMITLGLAGIDLAILHILPLPQLHATTGASIPYHPWNFLSEFVRTDYAPLMTACFFLLALSVLATAATVRHLRRETVLLAIAGIALVLLGIFPTDLADLTTNRITCDSPGRIEPCTMIGRIHNPLSTAVFGPILLVILSLSFRSHSEGQWRGVARWAILCGALAFCGIIASSIYERSIGWHGFWWTGLMQRSLVFPALLWMGGLLLAAKDNSRQEVKVQ